MLWLDFYIGMQNSNKINYDASYQSNSFECQSEEFKEAKDPEYHIRKDVVIKNIFRAFRRFYSIQFKSFYDFTKKKISKYCPSELEIIEWARKYVLNAFGTKDNTTSIALILAILDPTGKYTKQNGIYESMRQYISRLIFKFNKRILHELFQIPEFITILLHFLNKIEIKKVIYRFRDEEKTFEIYSKQMEKIREVGMDKRMYSSKYIYKFF